MDSNGITGGQKTRAKVKFADLKWHVLVRLAGFDSLCHYSIVSVFAKKV